jgi:AcrR family transcriptional regulator
LIHEKPYDAIALKEILHRANVGRSTFYTHFRDKDELLATAMDDLMGTAAAEPRLLRFSLPIFRHVDHHRHATRMGASGRASLHARLEREIAGVVAAELRGGALVPTELAIRHVTATFRTVLDWWVDTNSALSPAEVDGLFRALVLPALAGQRHVRAPP